MGGGGGAGGIGDTPIGGEGASGTETSQQSILKSFD